MSLKKEIKREKDTNPYMEELNRKQSQIRAFFKSPTSPFHYITYEQFADTFTIEQMNFKQQNLNIIDMHLRYRLYVREKMAPYKWIPIICLTPAIFSQLSLMIVIPAFTAYMFDHYFQRFFMWRHRKDRIINIRNQFATKLSKEKNKVRRVVLFQKLKEQLKRSDQPQEGIQPPLKYIKFGEYTQYLFHSNVGGIQQSSVLQTTLFDTFLTLKNFFIGVRQIGTIKQSLLAFKQDFMKFRADPSRKKYTIDTELLINRQDIKQTEIFLIEDNIDHTLRRYGELWDFLVFGKLKVSQFRLWEYFNFSKYQDIFEPIKYNTKDNKADLILYYSILAVPKLLNMIFRRR